MTAEIPVNATVRPRVRLGTLLSHTWCGLVACWALAQTPACAAARPGIPVGWGDYYRTNGIPAALSNVVAISAAQGYTLALTSEGRVVGWGAGGEGQLEIPESFTNAVAISAGYYFGLALGNNGRPTAWGAWGHAGYQAILDVPSDLTNAWRIAAGMSHSLAVRSNGTVVAWGHSLFGATSVPAGLSNVVDVAAGQEVSYALKSDGSVVAWGNIVQTDVPARASNVVSVSASPFGHAIAMRSDGTVVAWGNNQFGQADVPVGLSNVVAVAAGSLHSVALRADGTAVGWGRNECQQSSVPPDLTSLIMISAGECHSVALTLAPRVVSSPSGVTDVAGTNVQFMASVLAAEGWVGQWYFGDAPLLGATGETLLLTNIQAQHEGDYFLVATNGYGRHTSEVAHLTVLPSIPRILREPVHTAALPVSDLSLDILAAGSEPMAYQWFFQGLPLAEKTNSILTLRNVSVSDEGLYFVVVSNTCGAVTSRVVRVATSVPVMLSQSHDSFIRAGWSFSFEVTALSPLPVAYQWQFNGVNLVGATNATLAFMNLQAAAAGTYGAILRNSFGSVTSAPIRLTVIAPPIAPSPGAVVAWGSNVSGVLDVPSGLTNIVALAAGASHSLALRDDGTVAAWGDDGWTESSIPPWATNVAAILAGNGYTELLFSNGTAVAWGNTGAVPPEATNMQAIAPGMFLRLDGTIFSLGDAPPDSATNVVAMAVGYFHQLALRADGVVVGWGFNEQALPPSSARDCIAIAAGPFYSLALLSDGTIESWGRVMSPPPEATNIVLISAGIEHCLAVRDDGRVIVWGYTPDGQDLVPPGLAFPSAVSAGSQHDLALVPSGPPLFGRQPGSQAVVAGNRLVLGAFAVGAGPIHYQWMRDGTNLPGANHAYLTIANAQESVAANYTVVVTGSLGALTSAVATVTVVPSVPVIVRAPTNQVALPGSTAAMAVSAKGTEPMSYQWLFNGLPLSGATNAIVTLANVRLADAGAYQAVISNAVGVTTSAVARLEVYPFNLRTLFTNAPGTWTAAWGDFDNDGRLDLLVAGAGGPQNSLVVPHLLHNDGGGGFSEVAVGFGQTAHSAVWGDFDNDGFLDILEADNSFARVWHNNQNGTFSNLNLSLGGRESAVPALQDYDNDGRLDVLLGGILYRNLGGNRFTNINAGLPAVDYSAPAWGDFDNDGFADVLMCGLMNGASAFLLYRNLGTGLFANVNGGFVTNIYRGAGSWLDFDADGQMDFILSGQTGTGVPTTILYRNNGNATFTPVTSDLPPTTYASVVVGDCDNDGQPDIFLSGFDGTNNGGKLFRGAPSGMFTEVVSPFPTNQPPGGAWGDYDGDGRLDLALGVETPANPMAVGLFKNDVEAANTPPVPPTLLGASGGVSNVTFRWTSGSDAETPGNTLTYALRVGRSPGLGDVMAPDAGTNGVRRVARTGNTGTRATYTLTRVPLGRYYWAVQTVDSAFTGSTFTPEQVFTYAAMTLPATAIASSEATLNGLLETNHLPASAWFEWGTSTNFASSTPRLLIPTNAANGAVVVNLSGLFPSTTYFFRLIVTNADGTFDGGTQAFTTTDLPQIVPQAATAITASRATLHALVNPGGALTGVSFDYGLTRAYGTTTTSTNIGSGRAPVLVNRAIINLTGGQVYHYRVVATNSAGTAYSADLTFSTTTEPEVTTLAATNVAVASATLNGVVKPSTLPTDAFFEFGTTTNLGSVTTATNIPGGTNAVMVRRTVSGLAPHTPYFFRAVASNDSGVARGSILRFDTVFPPFLRAGPAAGGLFAINFAGTNGLAYQVQASTNLTQWISLGTATALPSNQFRFIDPSSTNLPRRFYRVLAP